jgi:protein SCO1/2
MLIAALVPVAPAQERLPAGLADVGLDQRPGAQVPIDLKFRDEAGAPVRLGNYFSNERPSVLVLAYFRCPMLCNEVLNGLGEGLRKVSLEPGKDYQVIVVSFDARETPELAAAKKTNLLDRYGRPGAAAGWHFLTGEQSGIDELARAVGFRYVYDPKLDQFAHASGITILTPAGTISRYFFGISYPPRDLRLGLVEASENRIGSPADRVLLLCYAYDPTTGQYTMTVLNLVRLGGVMTVVALGTFIALACRRERRRRPTAG